MRTYKCTEINTFFDPRISNSYYLAEYIFFFYTKLPYLKRESPFKKVMSLKNILNLFQFRRVIYLLTGITTG